MASLLERYRAGERERVWAELQGSAPGDEAWAVACETMRRARTNVETIHLRLKAARYPFDHPEWAWIPATPADAGHVQAIESRAGPMPLSLRAWYEIVGSVCWTGTDPAWKESDPLAIAPVEAVRDWCEQGDEGPFAVELSGDRLHKSGFSGGSYTIACGTPCPDGPVDGYHPRFLFVPYLRVCFRNGGFPGFEGYAAGEDELVRGLSKGLLEI